MTGDAWREENLRSAPGKVYTFQNGTELAIDGFGGGRNEGTGKEIKEKRIFHTLQTEC